jgi:hypothetical protein
MRLSIAMHGIALSTAISGALVVTAARADGTSTPPPSQAPSLPPQPAASAEAPQAPPESGNRPAPNSIYLEGLGAGLLYSINYERMVANEVGVRAGFSYMSFGASASSGTSSSSSSATFITIPVTASYIGIRARKHALELGGGATIAYASGSASGVGASASGAGVTPYGLVMVGYRLHPVDQAGFQLRVGLMALVGQGLALSNANPSAVGVLPWGYLSLGASF